MKLVKPTDRPIQEKFLTTRRELSAALIERDDEIDLVLTALIAQEHPLLVGPPGTAKSLLLDSLMTWMHGKKFTVLLTKFSTPEELFGPISVAGLKEDRYRRITTGKLPETDGAFVDEIFKASSAILNTLLRLLNERVFDAGDGTLVKVPLKICVAASNEVGNFDDLVAAGGVFTELFKSAENGATTTTSSEPAGVVAGPPSRVGGAAGRNAGPSGDPAALTS